MVLRLERLIVKPYKRKDFLQKSDEDSLILRTILEHRWGYGVVMPLIAAAYGVFVIYEKHAIISGRWYVRSKSVYGEGTVCHGISCLFIALFLHFGNFWRSFSRFERLGQIGV